MECIEYLHALPGIPYTSIALVRNPTLQDILNIKIKKRFNGAILRKSDSGSGAPAMKPYHLRQAALAELIPTAARTKQEYMLLYPLKLV
jgi:hypothetical protein